MAFQYSLIFLLCLLNLVVHSIPALNGNEDPNKVQTAAEKGNEQERKVLNNLPLTTNPHPSMTVVSTAAERGMVNNKQSPVFASSTPFDSSYGEEGYDYDRPFFQCRELGTRCSYVQRCCGSLRCRREKFYYFFGRCY